MEGSLRGLLSNPLPPSEQWMLWLNASGQCLSLSVAL